MKHLLAAINPKERVFRLIYTSQTVLCFFLISQSLQRADFTGLLCRHLFRSARWQDIIN